MKKFLLFVGFALTTTLSTAQVIFYVDPPSTNEGNYNFTWADPGGGDWTTPDLNISGNEVTGELCMASDGTAGDSLACNAITNTLTGKVAVLYRGDCEFGVKALNCENAGAVAVVIINNIAGAPVEMGGGAQGNNVTIPVIMISDIDGATLKAEAEACAGTTVFIGSKSGFYDDDLGFYAPDVLRAEAFSNLQALSQDASEFEVEIGAWVRNYGAVDQTNVTLQCVIDNGTEIYNETSTPEPTLLSGDSIYVALPTFSQSSYTNAYYNVTYTVAGDLADEFADDNEVSADFVISDSLFSYSRIDETTNEPVNVAYYRGGGSLNSNSGCIVFDDPNGSRVAVGGLTVSAVTSQNPDPSSMEGEFIQIFAYEWADVFADLNDANAAVNNIDQIAEGEYIYEADLQQENIYIPFDQPVLLSDDQRYLFCLTHLGENIFSGYDTQIDYNTTVNNYLQPQFPGESDGTWFLGGFGTDVVPAITASLFEATASIEEYTPVNLTAYPNPANAEVNIPLNENFGAVSLTITDMSGKVVNTQNIEMAGSILTVDVTNLASGSYVFNVSNGEKTEVITVSVNR
jgi:PA domain/Secretion system C-terminal sorting domain